MGPRKQIFIFFIAGVLVLQLNTKAGDTDYCNVEMEIITINEFDLVGGNVTLIVDSAVPGSDPEATDNTTADLKWTTNVSGKKITVQTGLGSPQFTIKVVAQNITSGTAAPEITLSTTAADFVTGIANAAGSCDLCYTAIAPVTAGTGTDVHQVTYTYTDA